jgi:hypothetical protein
MSVLPQFEQEEPTEWIFMKLVTYFTAVLGLISFVVPNTFPLFLTMIEAANIF